MEPEHSKQDTARGSTALSGKKVRLLAMALLFAVLAGAGFAIGEEKDVSEQANQQDADPKVIQLDGPIQPSAIITKDGVVIPKYEENVKRTPIIHDIKKKNIKTLGNGEIISNLKFIPPSSKGKEKFTLLSRNNVDIEIVGNSKPDFVSNFQIGDAKKLENEYIFRIPEHVIDYKPIREHDAETGLFTSAVGGNFPDVQLKWKYLGKRVVSGKDRILWQTAIFAENATGIGVYIKKVAIPPGSTMLMYGLYSSRWIYQYDQYQVNNKDNYKGQYEGNMLIIEFSTIDEKVDPNTKEYINIKSIIYSLLPFKKSSHMPLNDNLVMTFCALVTKSVYR